MSTKIYNGYKIKGSSLDEVIGKLFSNKKNLELIIYNEVKSEILIEAIVNYYNMVFSIFLGKDLGDKEENKKSSSALGTVISNALNNEYEKITIEREFKDISICLYPIKMGKKENYYVLQFFGDTYSEAITNNKLWKDLNIEEYAYWDNTDPPEELTTHEWNQREKDWKLAFGKEFIPSKSSLIIELMKEYKYRCLYMLDSNELKEILIDVFNNNLLEKLSKRKESLLNYYDEKIRDKIAYRAISSKYLKEDQKLSDLSEQEQKDLYAEVRNISRNKNFTDVEKSKIEEIMNKIKIVLNTEVEFEDLLLKEEEVQNKFKQILKLKIKP